MSVRGLAGAVLSQSIVLTTDFQTTPVDNQFDLEPRMARLRADKKEVKTAPVEGAGAACLVDVARRISARIRDIRGFILPSYRRHAAMAISIALLSCAVPRAAGADEKSAAPPRKRLVIAFSSLRERP